MCGVIGHSLRAWAIIHCIFAAHAEPVVLWALLEGILIEFGKISRIHFVRALIARILAHIQPTQLKLVTALSLCHRY
jgi:hypothetical protein